MTMPIYLIGLYESMFLARLSAQSSRNFANWLQTSLLRQLGPIGTGLSW